MSILKYRFGERPDWLELGIPHWDLSVYHAAVLKSGASIIFDGKTVQVHGLRINQRTVEISYADPFRQAVTVAQLKERYPDATPEHPVKITVDEPILRLA